MFDFDAVIRKVPDFPKPGILFYDITGILASPSALRAIRKIIVEKYGSAGLQKIVGVESRGFIFGTLAAESLGLPLVLARKKGKLPNEVYRRSYALEYGTDSLEIQKIDLHPGEKVLLVDDLIATGGTLQAVCEMIETEAKAQVAGIFAIIGLPFLNYQEVLKGREVQTLQLYHGE